MNIKLFVLVILILSLGGTAFFLRKKRLPPLPAAKVEGSSFFVPIRILGFTENKIPCLVVKIENNEFIFELDLGFNKAASISGKALSTIHEKAFVETIMSAGFMGHAYEVNTYQVPKIEIGKLNFHPVLLVEENELLQGESQIGKQKKESLGPIVGKIGCKAFENTGLFLDLKHSMIIVCDSAETLQKQGIPLNGFHKIPMIKDRHLIEIDVISSKGPLHCILDTGCTYNFIHADNLRHKRLDRMVTKRKVLSKFVMNGQDFGPISFSKLPIRCPFHIDALLGVEFLMDHAVFIDFVKGNIYVAQS